MCHARFSPEFDRRIHFGPEFPSRYHQAMCFTASGDLEQRKKYGVITIIKKYNRHSSNAPWGVNCWIYFFFVHVDKKPAQRAHTTEFDSSHLIFFVQCVCVSCFSYYWMLLIPLFIVSFIFQYDAHALCSIGRRSLIWISLEIH